MKALDILKSKNVKIKGKVLVCNKGGYRDDSFAYCISETEDAINVVVISAVNPREYQVKKSEDGKFVLQEFINAILYNEWKARTIHKFPITPSLVV